MIQMRAQIALKALKRILDSVAGKSTKTGIANGSGVSTLAQGKHNSCGVVMVQR